MSDRRLRSVAVVGDGVAGWAAAAALRRRVPGLSVTMVRVPSLQPSFADLIAGTPPSARDFHRDLGIDEHDLLRRTVSAYRLGSCFKGWTGDADQYVHAYGPAGKPINGTPFATLWARLYRLGQAPAFAASAPGAALGAAGRFAPPGREGMLSGYGYGLQLNSAGYRAYLETYARRLGVAVASALLTGVEARGDRVVGLALQQDVLTADFYVDATNAAGHVLGAIDEQPREDWSAWLQCDRMMMTVGGSPDALPVLDRVTAMHAGWRLDAALPTRTLQALVYRADLLDEAAAAARLSATTTSVRRFRSGRRRRAWIGNVVAIGEAHTVVEPLEAAPIHLIHAQIDRIVASLPDRDFADIELAQYNRETNQEADRLRDVVILHYAVAGRSEPFWRDAAAASLPPLLAETLRLFRERGRLPARDGETFTHDSLLQILFGQGVLPRREHIFALQADTDRACRAIAAHHRQLQSAVAAAPPHRAYLAALTRGAAT